MIKPINGSLNTKKPFMLMYRSMNGFFAFFHAGSNPVHSCIHQGQRDLIPCNCSFSIRAQLIPTT